MTSYFRRFLIIVVASLSLPSAALLGDEPAPPKSSDQLFAERDAEYKKLLQLIQQKDTGSAIDTAHEVARIDRLLLEWVRRDAPGKQDVLVAASARLQNVLAWLAERYEESGQFDQLIQMRRELVQLNEEAFGKDHWKSIDARLALKEAKQLAEATPAQRQARTKAQRLFQQCLALGKQGRFGEAINVGHQVAELQKATLGERHTDYAATLNYLGWLNHHGGNFPEAQRLYLQAAESRKETLGEDHPAYATSVNNLGAAHESRGQYAEAEKSFQRALELRRKVLGVGHPDYIGSLNNLGYLYRSIGDYARAEPLLIEATQRYRETVGEMNQDYANSLANLANVYIESGLYRRAEPLLRRSLEILQTTLGPQHPFVGVSMCNLGRVYFQLGDVARADQLFRHSGRIIQATLGVEHPSYATLLSNQAHLAASVGDDTRAEMCARRALVVRETTLGNKHPDYAHALMDIEQLMDISPEIREQLLDEARQVLEQSVGRKHPDYAACLGRLARVYIANGDLKKAEATASDSRAIIEETAGSTHAENISSLSTLAAIYTRTPGKLDQAISLRERVRALVREVMGADSLEYGRCLIQLAQLHDARGESEIAHDMYQDALRITREALEDSAVIQSEREQLAMAQAFRYQLDCFLSFAIRHPEAVTDAYREMLTWKGAIQVRQRAIREAATNPSAIPVLNEYQETATRLASLSRALPEPRKRPAWRQQLNNLTIFKERLESRLSEESAEFRAAQTPVALEALVAAMAEDTVLVDFIVSRAVVDDESGETPGVVKPILLAFVVRPERTVRLINLGLMEPLGKAIDTWRETFGESPGSAEAGRLLRDKIWEPIEPELDGARLVLLSPDGELGRLPFAALPGRQQDTYVVEEYRLATVPIPQLIPDLAREGDGDPAHPTLLLIGDVDYANRTESSSSPDTPFDGQSTSLIRGDEEFQRLPATAEEISVLETLFRSQMQRAETDSPDSVVSLTGTKATEDAFRDAAGDCSILHLATHGFFADPTIPSAMQPTGQDSFTQVRDIDTLLRGLNPGLLSGLVLAGANREANPNEDDGILTAEEIATLALDNAELVVLSACDTGLGPVAGGEGLLGVQRAFQVAGARTSVASLWSVDDRATRLLMETFYRNYWEEGMTKLDALRATQLAMLRHPEALQGHPEAIRGAVRLDSGEEPEGDAHKRLSPRYWAAFILSGDWR